MSFWRRKLRRRPLLAHNRSFSKSCHRGVLGFLPNRQIIFMSFQILRDRRSDRVLSGVGQPRRRDAPTVPGGVPPIFLGVKNMDHRKTICRGPLAALTRLSALHFPIKFLQYKERLLFFSMLGYQTFAIEVILNSRQGASRAAKVFQNPWCSSTQKWNAF